MGYLRVEVRECRGDAASCGATTRVSTNSCTCCTCTSCCCSCGTFFTFTHAAACSSSESLSISSGASVSSRSSSRTGTSGRTWKRRRPPASRPGCCGGGTAATAASHLYYYLHKARSSSCSATTSTSSTSSSSSSSFSSSSDSSCSSSGSSSWRSCSSSRGADGCDHRSGSGGGGDSPPPLGWCRGGVPPACRRHLPTTYLSRSTRQMFLYLLFLICHWTLAKAQGVHPAAPDLCVVRTPLDTPHLTGVVDDPVPCAGCLFPLTSGRGEIDQVHVLHVTAPSSGRVLVVLQGTFDPPAPRVALLLHSSLQRGTTFTVTAPEDTALPPPTVLVSGKDRVEGAGPRVQHHQHAFPQHKLVAAAYTQLGFLTSFTRSTSATRVVMHLDRALQNSSAGGGGCDASAHHDSPVASCTVARPVPLAGCYHRTVHRTGIHIISVDGSHDGVTVEVVGTEGTEEGSPSTDRQENLTLVLTSHQPRVRWTLSTTRIRGTITVVLGRSDAQLEQAGSNVDGGVQVVVQRRQLPQSFDQLLMTVLNTIGQFNSYTTSTATRIRLTVTPLPELDELVQKWLGVECPPRHLIASLPRWATNRITETLAGSGGGTEGAQLTLSMVGHPHCTSKDNGTHLVLDARLDSCGFWKEMHRQKGLFVNEVTLTAMLGASPDDEETLGSGSGLDDDDEDYGGRGGGGRHLHTIKVHCPAPVGLPENTIVPQPAPPAIRPALAVLPTVSLTPALDSLPYRLSVKLLPGSAPPADGAGAAAAAAADQVLLLATATIDTAVSPWLRLVLEQCWLNSSPSSTRVRKTLVRKSCEVSPSVVMLPREHHHTTAFTFTLAGSQRETYLYCKVGICATEPERAKEKLLQQCTEPSLYCHKLEVRPIFFGFTPASQLRTLTAGPLLLTTERHDVPAADPAVSAVPPARSAAAPSTDQQKLVVMEGVATEIVVGISISSFLIGVCLTGALWIIHVRTDPRRQRRPEPTAPRNSGYDLSANSGSTTPSSQAPMTA